MIESGQREGVCVVVPTLGMNDYRAWGSWTNLEYPSGLPHWWSVAEDIEHIGPDKMRNFMLQTLRARIDPEWFLCVDDDTLLPRDAVIRLLEHGEKVAAGVVPLRKRGFSACIIPEGKQAAKMDWKIGDVIYGDTGAACMLIHRDALEAIRSAWFEKLADLDEGLNFCHKARDAGFRPVVDTRVQCGHILRESREVLWTRQQEDVLRMDRRVAGLYPPGSWTGQNAEGEGCDNT